MAKDKKGSGIQQAAGLIRYFDEESEDAIQISRGMIYFACISFSVTIYLANHGVLHWLADTLDFNYSDSVKSTKSMSLSSKSLALISLVF